MMQATVQPEQPLGDGTRTVGTGFLISETTPDGKTQQLLTRETTPGGALKHAFALLVEARPSGSKPFGTVTFACKVFNRKEQVALILMTPIIATRGAP